jgi:hypothetical protein
VNPIVTKAIEDVLPAILALGTGREKLFVSLDWHIAVAIHVPAAEPQIEMTPFGIVCDGSQHP